MMLNSSSNNDEGRGGIPAGGSPSSSSVSSEGIVISTSTLVAISATNFSLVDPTSTYEVGESSVANSSFEAVSFTLVDAVAVAVAPSSTYEIGESSSGVVPSDLGDVFGNSAFIIPPLHLNQFSSGAISSSQAVGITPVGAGGAYGNYFCDIQPLPLDQLFHEFPGLVNYRFAAVNNTPGAAGDAFSNSFYTIQPWQLIQFCQVYPGFVNFTLDEFRVNPSRFTLLQHVLGSAFQFSVDVAGRLVVQRCLNNATYFEMALFLMEIVPHLRILAGHPNGNHVLQTFILACNSPALVDSITCFLRPDIPFLSCHYYGHHVIEKLIGHITQEMLCLLVNDLSGYVPSLALSEIGSNVIQAIIRNCDDHPTLAILVSQIIPHVQIVASNPYGNYVLQDAIRRVNVEVLGNLISSMMDQGILLVLLQGEYAHHVYRCLVFSCDGTQLQVIIQELRMFLNVHGVILRQSESGVLVIRRVRYLIHVGQARLSM